MSDEVPVLPEPELQYGNTMPALGKPPAYESARAQALARWEARQREEAAKEQTVRERFKRERQSLWAQPLERIVLLELLKAEESEGGIVIAHDSSRPVDVHTARVLSCGPQVTRVKPDDIVLVKSNDLYDYEVSRCLVSCIDEENIRLICHEVGREAVEKYRSEGTVPALPGLMQPHAFPVRNKSQRAFCICGIELFNTPSGHSAGCDYSCAQLR